MKKFKRVIPICFLTVLLALGLTGCGSNTYNYESKDFSTTRSIKSLDTGNESSGVAVHSFALGYSIQGETTYYYVYAEQTPGEYLLEKYDASKTYICEDGGDQPVVVSVYKSIAIPSEEYQDIIHHSLGGGPTILINNKKATELFGAGISSDDDMYTHRTRKTIEFASSFKGLDSDTALYVADEKRTLHVPKGTIKVKYDVTLPKSKEQNSTD